MTSRSVTRGCAIGLAGLGAAVCSALWSAPAFALDLPSAPPVPAPASSPLPDPVASLVPSPVQSALAPVLAKLPGQSPSPSPSPKPSPAPAATEPPQAAPQPQAARALTGFAALPAGFPDTAAMRAGHAELQQLPGVVAPVAVAPVPVTPQLAPAAATPASLPGRPDSPQGPPALLLAVAIGTVSAVAAGQVAEMHARRVAAS